jgi:DNA-directed RNA polymerase sigma subunit (sigma70/sigma32)
MSKLPTDLRARGSRHGAAKLTERDVREIRRRYGKGRETFAALATAFNVSPQTIGGIVHRRSWQHVA